MVHLCIYSMQFEHFLIDVGEFANVIESILFLPSLWKFGMFVVHVHIYIIIIFTICSLWIKQARWYFICYVLAMVYTTAATCMQLYTVCNFN